MSWQQRLRKRRVGLGAVGLFKTKAFARGDVEAAQAPYHFNAAEAQAWAWGYNSACRDIANDEPQRDRGGG